MENLPESVKHILSGVKLPDNSRHNFQNNSCSTRTTGSVATNQLHSFIHRANYQTNWVPLTAGVSSNAFSRWKAFQGCSGETTRMHCEWPHVAQSSFIHSKSSNKDSLDTCPICDQQSGWLIRDLLGGGLAGLVAYTSIYPMDLVKTLVSLNLIPANESLFKSLTHIQGRYGWLGLYQGLTATIYVGLKGVNSIFGN